MDRRGGADNRADVRSLRLIIPTLAAMLLTAIPASADAPRSPTPTPRIVNGHAPSQTWPAQTSIRLQTALGNFVCGGTLVSARWVLTAGHCATEANGAPLFPAAFTLNVGGTTRTNGTPAVVDQVLVDPAYTTETMTNPPSNDLAVLHLTSPMTQDPMPMIGIADTPFWSPGVQATIIGWGVTESGFQSGTLVEAQAPMVGDTSCQNIWGSSFASTSMVCAGGFVPDTCGGDSGGPLMVPRDGAFTLAGVTSWGTDPCGQPLVPGVYSRLGAPALNAFVRSKVPAIELAASTTAAAPGQQVDFTATVTNGSATTTPTLTWDLDDDGAFDDATGTTASATFPVEARRVVRVQALYPNPDGDRAAARKLVVVANPPPPPPPAPAPAAPEPPAPPVPAPVPAAGSFAAPTRITLPTLRRSGVRVRYRCVAPCTITGRLTLDATAARRFGLRTGKRSVTIGGAITGRASAGTATMTVHLTTRAKRQLRRAKKLAIRLTTELSAGGATSVQGTLWITVSR